MVAWTSALELVLPQLLCEVGAIRHDSPEATFLPLRSRLTASTHEIYGLQEATRLELVYRKIQAHALLTECRLLVFDSDHGYQLKAQVTGQQKNTRMGRLTNDFNHEKASARALYNHVRKCMLNICEDEKELYMFKKLDKEHMYCKALQQASSRHNAQAHATGKETKTPWLWQIVKHVR